MEVVSWYVTSQCSLVSLPLPVYESRTKITLEKSNCPKILSSSFRKEEGNKEGRERGRKERRKKDSITAPWANC